MTQTFKESFHNSIKWSVLYLQVNIPPRLAEIFRFTVFRLLEKAFKKKYQELDRSNCVIFLISDIFWIIFS